MEKITFEKALKLHSEIEELKKKIKDLSDGCWSKCEITLGTGNYSMNNEIKRSITLKDDIGLKLGEAFRNIISERISELEKEFESL